MLRIIIEEKSSGRVLGTGVIGYETAEPVSDMEIKAMWESVRSPDFKDYVKSRLIEVCVKHGFDARACHAH